MAALLINHVQDTTSDEDVRKFLMKYGFPSYDRIQRVAGDGSRPAVLLTFDDCSAAALRTLLPRIHQIFWNNHTITALVLSEPRE
ncbi:RNA-binding protein [Bordetella bronchialis]|uniref:RNA-binding protein n=1 Tax=Bordetella bronchialis TaxID=463025 RepID=A0A193FPA7_9BORD|nr:RNA-binding protein [Bordetella bronchialis]ANN69011.1 hypothetical protein BAU06_24315 [Bordetella bronchialis]ANN74161.1 hypothetical protein BAU08_24890 [Bordetella bronchialis]